MRIISLAPSATEVVFALDRGDQLVGRTAFCDYPSEAKKIPTVGGWTTANIENVLALNPDLVLTSTFLQDRIVGTLRNCGILVCHADPRTLVDVLDSFVTIATALGVPDRGAALRSQVESEFASLLPTAHPVEARDPEEGRGPHGALRPRGFSGSLLPRIYAEEWPEPPMASGNWVPDLISLAGGTPLFPSGQPSRKVSLDEIAAFDPDVILLNYCGMAVVPAEKQAARVRSRPEWQNLRAVRAGRIVVLDDALLNRPSPRLVEGARAIQRALASFFPLGTGGLLTVTAGEADVSRAGLSDQAGRDQPRSG